MMPSIQTIRERTSAEESLVRRLRRQLNARRYRPGEFVTTETDLARSAGVKRIWARRAVDVLVNEGKLQRRPGKGLYLPDGNGHPHGAESTAALVQVVVPNVTNNMWGELARGVKQAAARAGWRTLIYDAHFSMDSDIDAIRALPRTSPRGAVIVSIHHQRFVETLYELKRLRYPFVLVDETLRGADVPCVLADNYQGGYRVGRELIRRGHRRIGFVGMDADTVRARLAGLRDAMLDEHLHFDRALVASLSEEPIAVHAADVARCVQAIINHPDWPTAIFFCNDLAAANGYRAIRKLGLRIPEDISVVGFDGLSICRLLTPTLASVRQPVREMGAVAMEMLLALTDGDLRAGESRTEAGVVNGAACTPVAVRDGLKADGCGDTAIWGHGEGGGLKAEGGRNGQEVSVAGRGVTPMETDAPEFSRPRRPAANTTRGQDDAWHRVLPVTWQDGESIGPAPGAAGDFTTKDTKNTKATDGSQ